MLREKLSQWIKQEREKGNTNLTVSTVGVLSDFCYWLESDAEQRRGADADTQTCPSCDGEGTGFEDGESWTCSICYGTGQV